MLRCMRSGEVGGKEQTPGPSVRAAVDRGRILKEIVVDIDFNEFAI